MTIRDGVGRTTNSSSRGRFELVVGVLLLRNLDRDGGVLERVDLAIRSFLLRVGTGLDYSVGNDFVEVKI